MPNNIRRHVQIQQQQQTTRTAHFFRTPIMSLFNRLETLSYQLHSSREFFALWPDKVCSKMRSTSSSSSIAQQHQTNNNNNATIKTKCWNGQETGR